MTEDNTNRSDPKDELSNEFRESFFGSEEQDQQASESKEFSASGPTTQELRELSHEKIREKYGVDDEDHPLVKQTGKAHIQRRVEPTAENAVFFLFLQGLSDSVERISSDVQENLDRGETTRVDLPLGEVGIGLFQIHALTISYFEASSYLLVTDKLRRSGVPIQPFVDYYDSTPWKEVVEDHMNHEETIQAIYSDLEEKANAGQYQHMLDRADLIDSTLFDLVDDVREARNTYIHNPMLMVEIAGHKQVIEMIAKCISVITEIEELLEQELEIDWTIYKALEGIE
ncbi:hypothetical protein [Haloarcula amylovorans]|uniref:hypothetical protein n=1 Tax=Haloarcula amylovorans TaxID=2562280 RepID=UPI00107635C3|nr:hypothetical protein [Halomicroarcula amylolytica]